MILGFCFRPLSAKIRGGLMRAPAKALKLNNPVLRQMPYWIHLDVNFKGKEVESELANNAIPLHKPAGIYKELILYLKTVVDSCQGLIGRYFFLFEPQPDIFLALELKDKKDIHLIEDKINKIAKPEFISSAKVVPNTHDDGHDEAVLDMFYTSAKYAFYRISDDYKPDNFSMNEFHAVHCFCNPLFCDLHNEINFYATCLKAWTGSIVNRRKRK